METKPYIYGLSYKGNLVYIGLHNGKDKYYFSGGVIPKRMGKDKFVKGVIEYCSCEDLTSREVYYIQKYTPRFNLTSGGEQGELGVKHSKSTIEKRKRSFMSNVKHIERITEVMLERNRNNNPCVKHLIRCIETGEVFNSIREAGRKLNIDNSYLAKHLKGRYDSVRGLTFERI